MPYDPDVATILADALPIRFHADIPVLARLLTAARDGVAGEVATENLQAALRKLQGQEIRVQSGNIKIGTVSGSAIAIGHGEQVTVIHIHMPHGSAEKQAWRNRSRMLEKVRASWITEYLDQSLQQIGSIKLGIEYFPAAQSVPWATITHSADNARDLVPETTSITDLFDQADGALLILGIAGVGKTTVLLELTRTLIERAQQDNTHPIPAVFHLASWAVKRLPLADWLVDELNLRYAVPRRVARAWVADDRLVLLLDGLDEVQQEQRAACVEAINSFHALHNRVKLGVCSRLEDYRAVTTALQLRGAALIHALSNEQIDTALCRIGDTAGVARQVYQRLQDNARAYSDHAAQALLRTPLMLTITILAYSDCAGSDLQLLEAPPAEQQRRLFTTYIDRMLKRRVRSEAYTAEQTRHWLTWAARQMHANNQVVLQVELMQPWWLGRWWQRWLYICAVMVLAGLGGLGLGLLAGLVLGLTGGLALEGLIWMLPEAAVMAVPRFSDPGRGLLGGFGYGLFINMVFGLFCGLAGGLFTSLAQRAPMRQPGWYPWIAGVLTIGSLMLFYSPLSDNGLGVVLWAVLNPIPSGLAVAALARRGEIRPTETVQWSWHAFRARWYLGPGFGLVFGLLFGVTQATMAELVSAFVHGLGDGLVGWIIGWLVAGLTSPELPADLQPNEGIRRSFRNAAVIWLGSGLVAGLVIAAVSAVVSGSTLGLAFGVRTGLDNGLQQGFVYGLAGGLVGALAGWLFVGPGIGSAASLYFGGLAFVQHYTLRYICTLVGTAPWNYPRFLNYAVERLLLRRVGGGYIFVHRTLLEYFAGVEIGEKHVAQAICSHCGQPYGAAARLCPYCRQPVAQANTGELNTPAADPNRWFRAWGIASIVLGVLSIVIALTLVILTEGFGNDPQSVQNFIGGILLLTGWIVNTIGLITGGISLLRRYPQRTYAYVGLAFNLLVFVPMCVLIMVVLYQLSQS
jgi:hypothetical protein